MEKALYQQMIYRGLKICLNYFRLDNEIEFIQKIALAYGYPSKFRDQQSGFILNR